MRAPDQTLVLCVYGFFSSLRPSEPFLTAYLMGPDHNLTEAQVVNELYPVWTYSYLALLLPVFLLTDLLRYKPVLLLQAASLLLTSGLLLLGGGGLGGRGLGGGGLGGRGLGGLGAMQLMEVLFGLASASEVAYYSYIYSVVPPARYQRVTGQCRGAALLGSAAGSLIGQLLLLLPGVRLAHLVLATLGAAAVASAAPWLLPLPQRSLFFHQRPDAPLEKSGAALLETGSTAPPASQEDPPVGSSSQTGRCGGASSVLRALVQDLLRCYRCRPLLAWSLWWALATCGYFQVINYAQALWEGLRPAQGPLIYNGYVETLATLLGALAALLVGHLPVSWSLWGEAALCVLSLLMALCVVAMATLGNIWLSYSCYVLFRAIYMLLITVATYQVAASLSVRRYALVFGVNTFVALLLQTVLTVAVVDSAVLGLDVFTQFLIYGGYFAVISVVFLLAALFKLASRRRCKRQEELQSRVRVQVQGAPSEGCPQGSREPHTVGCPE